MSYRLKAALKTSIVPEIGPLPTSFTRNQAAYVADFEGRLVLVPANCARFGGARFVQNILQNSNLNGATGPGPSRAPAAWSYTGNAGVAPLTIVSIPNTFGATFAVQVRETSTGGFQGFQQAVAWALGVPYIIHARVRRPAGVVASNVNLYFGSATPGSAVLATAAQLNAQPDDAWVWYSTQVTFTASASNALCFINPGAATGTGFDIAAPMVEMAGGRSNQSPSEYLGTNLLAWPFQGAGADGCQFFDCLNGNTVDANNVVTEAEGAAIPAATLLRRLNEPASTNILIASADLTNAAWVKTQATIVADVAVGPDGTTTMDKWVPNTGIVGNSARLHQLFTATANQAYTLSFFASAAGQSKVLVEKIGAFGAVETGQVTFDLAAGVMSTTGTITGTMKASQRFAGLYECTVKLTATATPGTGGFQFDQAGGVVGDGASGIALGFLQVEAAPVRSSYIPTTAAAVARPADRLTWPGTLVNDAQGTAYARVAALDWTANSARILGAAVGSSRALLGVGSNNGGAFIFDGTTIALGPAGAPAGTVKAAATWGPNGQRAFSNGVPGAAVAYDGSMEMSGGVGDGYGLAGFDFAGYIGDVVILDTALSEFDVPNLPDYQYPALVPGPAGRVVTPAIAASVPQLAIGGSVSSSPSITGVA